MQRLHTSMRNTLHYKSDESRESLLMCALLMIAPSAAAIDEVTDAIDEALDRISTNGDGKCM